MERRNQDEKDGEKQKGEEETLESDRGERERKNERWDMETVKKKNARTMQD